MSTTRPKVAIIGTGWTGIACATTLIKNGLDVDIFEKLDDIGGTWNPSNTYANLRIHGLTSQIEFPDFELPGNIDRCERLGAKYVFNYLKEYCKLKNLYQYISFKKDVKAIYYDSKKEKVFLDLIDLNTQEEIRTDAYDYLLHTDGFTTRKTPKFKGSDKFKGQIFHSLDMTQDVFDSLVSDNKKIAVLGGSKSATDCIENFYKAGFKAHWIYKEPFYFLNYDYIKKIAQNRLQKKNFIRRQPIVYIISTIFANISPRLAMQILFWTGKIKTFGKSHSNFKKCHLGMLDNNQIKVLKEFSQKYGIQDSISHLSEHQIHLANGKTLDVDALICCTGSHVSNDAIPEIYIDHKPHAPDEFKHVYREHVLPEMPRIIFTSYIVMGAGVNGALNQAAWALNYMRLQPNEAYLKKESEYNEKPFLLNPMLFAKDEYMIKRVRAFWELLLRKDEVTMSALALVNWYFETVCSPFAARVVEFKKSSTE